MHVDAAASAALAANLTVDWVIAEHCLANFAPDPKPSIISPAIAPGKTAGHWIGPRGRHMTVREAARIQGYLANELRWEFNAAFNFFMTGITVSV